MFKGEKLKRSLQQNQNQSEKTLPELLTEKLEDNIGIFKDLFKNDDTIIFRRFENKHNNDIKCCIIFVAEMIDNAIINDNIIKPVVSSKTDVNTNGLIDSIMLHDVMANNVQKLSEIEKLTEAIVMGNTVLLLDRSKEALVINTPGWQTRSITEPEGEKLIRGPREGFTESLLMNLTMVRRKVLTNNLKFQFRTLGVQTHTKICLCYIEGIANQQILDELNKRLDKIDIDGLMGSGTIAELIKDSPLSPFKTVGSTERPDVIVGKLLEGRIAVIVNGTPVALTLPFVFIEYFQSNEDYYINYYFSSINRIIRLLSFLLTVGLPGIYVALTAFHQEMVPTTLIKSISAARQSVPFPTVVELSILLIAFEILREAGTRMPTNIGQALSIVGALVLGQASVEARIVSAPIVIIVALTAITGLALPRLKGAEILLRGIFLLLSSIIGLFGFNFGLIGLLIHLFSLRSFGVPYMLSLNNIDAQDLQDTMIRAPWFYIKYRPKFISSNNRRRNNPGGKKQ